MTTIRYITLGDSEKFLHLCKQLDQETEYMMLEPDERVMNTSDQTHQIEGMLNSGNSMIFVAEEGNKLVGYLSVRGGTFRRTHHKAHIVIGILQSHTRMGVGTALFSQMEKWSRESNVHRLELTVMAHNEFALGLYKKMGFVIEGTSKDSLFVNGRYVDEYYMAKILY